jgi:sigma-B regulation protein RsbU (phosphoserine phosphatase)
MFYAILDVGERTITFARAGQCPLILTQEPGQPGSFLSPPGMALGLEMGKVFDSVLEEQSVSLATGEVLVFYTDGFTEAMNEKGDEFGEERLVASVARHRDEPAARIIREICTEVSAFAGSRAQHDDMTMVVIKVL